MAAETVVSPRFLARSRAADVDWDAFYEAELPRVYNFFRYRVGCTAEAEDLTAATFEKAWRARDSYRRDLASFATWLLTIARHVAIDHYRRHRDEVGLDAVADQPSPDRTPEQSARLRSEIDRLSALLATLPEREREVLALKYGAEATNRTIAKVTGLSESNIGTILHRTLKDLRARWDA